MQAGGMEEEKDMESRLRIFRSHSNDSKRDLRNKTGVG